MIREVCTLIYFITFIDYLYVTLRALGCTNKILSRNLFFQISNDWSVRELNYLIEEMLTRNARTNFSRKRRAGACQLVNRLETSEFLEASQTDGIWTWTDAFWRRNSERSDRLARQTDDKQTVLVGSLLLFDAPSLINPSRLDDPRWPPITSWYKNPKLSINLSFV